MMYTKEDQLRTMGKIFGDESPASERILCTASDFCMYCVPGCLVRTSVIAMTQNGMCACIVYTLLQPGLHELPWTATLLHTHLKAFQIRLLIFRRDPSRHLIDAVKNPHHAPNARPGANYRGPSTGLNLCRMF